MKILISKTNKAFFKSVDRCVAHVLSPKIFNRLRGICASLVLKGKLRREHLDAKVLRQPLRIDPQLEGAKSTLMAPQAVDLNNINDPITFSPVGDLIHQGSLPIYALAEVHAKELGNRNEKSVVPVQVYYAKTAIQWALTQAKNDVPVGKKHQEYKDIYNGLPAQKIDFHIYSKTTHQKELSVSWSPKQKNAQEIDPLLKLILKMETSPNETISKIYCLALGLALIQGAEPIFPSRFFPQNISATPPQNENSNLTLRTKQKPDFLVTLLDEMDDAKKMRSINLAVIALAHLLDGATEQENLAYKQYLQKLTPSLL